MARKTVSRRCWVSLDATASLNDVDASSTPGFSGEEASAREQTEVLRTELVELQARLYAESRQRLLVVLLGGAQPDHRRLSRLRLFV